MEIGGIAKDVVGRAAQKKLTVATAESCTGGGIGYCLTSAPGSSDVFLGGIISYHNHVKTGQLGVPEDLLIAKGAVSPDVATLMAENVRLKLGADIGLSATGVAGPGGGSALKPVGLVFVGLAQTGRATIVSELRCGDIGREEVRVKTVQTALEMLRGRLV